jgi:hypothetical protein
MRGWPALGWQVAGVDISTPQVAPARRAGLAAVAASATALPLAGVAAVRPPS